MYECKVCGLPNSSSDPFFDDDIDILVSETCTACWAWYLGIEDIMWSKIDNMENNDEN